MPAPTLYSGGWSIDSETSAGTGNVTKNPDATTIGAIAYVIGATGSASTPSLATTMTYGNVALAQVINNNAINSNAPQRGRRATIYWMTPLDSARADNVFRWAFPAEATQWLIGVTLLNRGGGDNRLKINDTETYTRDSGAPATSQSQMPLTTPPGFALWCSLCDNSLVEYVSGATTIQTLFSGSTHAAASYRANSSSITVGHQRSFGVGPWVASSALFGGERVGGGGQGGTPRQRVRRGNRRRLSV